MAANEKSLRELIDGACDLWKQPKLSDQAFDFYRHALSKYTLAMIREALYRCVDDSTYFPRPKDILERIKDKQEVSEHDKDLSERWTCRRCGFKVSALTSDGVCLNCQGVPTPGYERIKPLPEPEPIKYRMEGSIKCQNCGHVGLCIKDPADSNTSAWLCRTCYSGMSMDQYRARVRGITGKIGGENDARGKETHRVQRVSQSRRRVGHDIKWEMDAGQQGTKASDGGNIDWSSGIG